MRLDEIQNIHDVINADQYITLLRRLKTNVNSGINVARIKSQVIQHWKRGMKSRKHYDKLLASVNLNLHDLIE